MALDDALARQRAIRESATAESERVKAAREAELAAGVAPAFPGPPAAEEDDEEES